jgi:hypothetical protein
VDIARLILEYIQALIWPALVAGALIRFGPYIWDLVKRVSSGGQLQVGGPGFQVLMDFRETVRQIAEDSADPELRESAKEVETRLDRELLALTPGFYTASLTGRQQLAEDVRQRTAPLSFDELVALADSADPGERVAAGIGLGERLRHSERARDDPRAVATIRGLINDRKHSRVRYRGVEALLKAPQLVPNFEDDLARLAARDSNSEVKRLANRALLAGRGRPIPGGAETA